MNKVLDVVVADSSGNITIMVLTPVERCDYAQTAHKLLENKLLGGEQVAFILPADKTENHMPEMEMCGLEFCGNASRAFALHQAVISRQNNLNNEAAPHEETDITIKVSGCDYPLKAEIITVDDSESAAPADAMHTAYVKMDMPVPSRLRTLSAKDLKLQKDGLLVSTEGISHLILEDIPPMLQTFEDLREYIYEHINPDLPAFGVMFCDTVNNMMTPVVYVKNVDTTYFEGSCASGTVAAAYAMAQKLPDGTHEFTMQQPEGTLHTTVIKKQDLLESIILKGPVTLSDVISVEL